MKDIKIALVQTSIVWQDTRANLEKYEQILAKVDEDARLVILPEMFSSGFTMEVENLEKPVGKKAFEWMKEKAVSLQRIIVGSILTEENRGYFNRMYWMRPDGTYDYYDKRHLFHMAGEHRVMTAGEERKIVQYGSWKFNLQICYDLRFPVWSKNHYDAGKDEYEYDVLIYIANWPEVRKEAYLPLIRARAIENQAYVIWVNRTGEDGNGIPHSGDTQIVDPYGKIVAKLEAHQEGILYGMLEGEKLQHFRKKFKVGLDWDEFNIL